MVCSLLQTYTKLRQLSRLFSVLLSVVCRSPQDDRPPPLLSDSVSTSLRVCLLDIPSSQVLEICSSVLRSIRTCVLPGLVEEHREAETTEADGDPRSPERNDASVKLLCLSQLLHVVLFSLKTLDDSSPAPLVRRSSSFMEEMQQTVEELLRLLADEASFRPSSSSVQKTSKRGRNVVAAGKAGKVSKLRTETSREQKTQEAVLLLRYTWVEVDTLLRTHCSRYTSVHSLPAPPGAQSLGSGSVSPSRLHPSPSASPTSCLLLRLLALQQLKRVLLESASVREGSAAAKRAVRFIVAEAELEGAELEGVGPEGAPAGEQVWDGQVSTVTASTYPVAHWHLVVSNLPLLAPHLSGEGVGRVAHTLVGSSLNEENERWRRRPPGSLTLSGVSSQLTRSSAFPELAPVFSATVRCLSRRIVGVLKAGRAPEGAPTFLAVHEEEAAAVSSELDLSRPVFSPATTAAAVKDVLTSSDAREARVLLTDAQTEEFLSLLRVLTSLSPDGMSSEDLSSVFLLLLFTLTSTSGQPVSAGRPEPEGEFLGELLGALTFLLGGANAQSVLKLVPGGALLQTVLSSFLRRGGRTGTFADRLDAVEAARDFVKSSVRLILVRNSRVKLNLDQFLTSKEAAGVLSGSESSTPSVYLLLASLTSFSEAVISNLGRSKTTNQHLIQTLARTTALLGSAAESLLKRWTACGAGVQPAGVLGQAFVVEVFTVLLNCELALLSEEAEGERTGSQLTYMTLYQMICQQILREISSAPRPADFLLFSLRFLSVFYKTLAVLRAEEEPGEEMDELYVQIVQNVLRLLKGIHPRTLNFLLF